MGPLKCITCTYLSTLGAPCIEAMLRGNEAAARQHNSNWQLMDSFSPWPMLATALWKRCWMETGLAQVPLLTDWVRCCFNPAADARGEFRRLFQPGCWRPRLDDTNRIWKVTRKSGMQSRGFPITLVGRPQEGPCRLITSLSMTSQSH